MVVVITGASSGIGQALAKELVNNGNRVYSFSLGDAQDAGVNYINCDVSSERSVKDAFKEFSEKEKCIDVLVNNAGIGVSGSVENTSEEALKKIFDVNFFGAVYASKCAAKKMRESGSGKILFTSSVAAVYPIAFQTFYSASKMSMGTLSDCLRMELKPYGVQSGTLLLGDINTGFTARNKKDLSGEGVYEARVQRSLAYMSRDEDKGMTPEQVAKKIAKYINKKKVKPTKVFGNFFYKIVCVVAKIAPKSAILRVLYKMYAK